MSKMDEAPTRGEDEAPTWRRPRPRCADPPGATVCVAASVLCLGVCVVVLLRTSELQSRVVSLEQQVFAWTASFEQVEPVILGRVERLLDEVRPAQVSSRTVSARARARARV